MLNFHQNTKVHKHYIDFVIFSSSSSFVYLKLMFTSIALRRKIIAIFSFDFFHFYMEIITLHFVCTCVNLCFSHFSSLQATTKIDYMKYLLLCMCFFLSLNITINTTSLGSHTHMSINTDSFHVFYIL